jgi:hypothetical protein
MKPGVQGDEQTGRAERHRFRVGFAPSPDAAAMKPPEGLAWPCCAFLRYDFSSYQWSVPL